MNNVSSVPDKKRIYVSVHCCHFLMQAPGDSPFSVPDVVKSSDNPFPLNKGLSTL